MMKRFVLILLILLPLAGWGQVIFQRSYVPDTAANKLEGMAIVKKDEGGYMITGNLFSLPPTLMPRNVTLHRLDSLGQMIDSRVYYSPSALSGYASHIEKTGDGNFIITATHTFSTGLPDPYWAGSLIKIDSAGTILWNRVLYDSTFHTNTRLIKTIAAGNFYYSVGETNVNRNVIANWYNDTTFMGLITKTDQQGNLIWAKNYYNRTIRFKDFALTPDSGLFVVADRTPFDSLGSNKLFGLFIRLDSAGNAQWVRQWEYAIGGYLNAALNDGSGLLIAARNAVSLWSEGIIIKLDYSGNFLWANKFGTAGGDYEVKLLALSDNQKIAFNMGGLFFRVLDQLSNNTSLHWLPHLSIVYGSWLNQIYPLQNDGLCGVGQRGWALFVFKTDSNFYTCFPSGMAQNINTSFTFDSVTISDLPLSLNYSELNFTSSFFNTTDTLHCLTATAVSEYEPEMLPEVYPTFVVDNTIYIRLYDLHPVDFNVTLLDITGRTVFYRTFNASTGVIPLKIPEQTNGLYLLKVETNEKTLVKKIIISKN